MKKQLCLLLLSFLTFSQGAAQQFPYEIDWDAVDEGVQQIQQGVEQLASSEKVQRWAIQATGRIQKALGQADWNQLQEWLPYIDQVEAYLSSFPEAEPYVDWLSQRRDYFVFAKTHTPQLLQRPVAKPQVSLAPTARPAVAHAYVPPVSYEYWVSEMSERTAPKGSAALARQVKPLFRKYGVPEELVWLAEVESSFNPKAQSPVGARGLFQFMPATARYMGLSTSPLDERIDPEKSADAAARYLAKLYGRFGDWPLTLAAYNAGEGRVSGLLKQASSKDYNGIQSRLPSETRMYVPKVLATIQVREGVSPEDLPEMVK
ncbi:lytic transglycosylase domain-containing protein [Kiritimatiellota bacterium B12222]|nr:lytic transglycosylase domain-containing protein [Kiritimatiellota bacterium B12222]